MFAYSRRARWPATGVVASRPFSPADRHKSRSDLLHASLRRKQIELCRSIPGILNFNSYPQRVDVLPRLWAERYRTRSSTQNEQIRLWPDKVKDTPGMFVHVELTLGIQYLALSA